MAPYLLLLLFVTASGFLFCELRRSRRSDLIFLLVTCTVMFAMSSLRGITVGVDNKLYYLPYFERMVGSDISFLWSAENVYRSEPGYSLLVYLISRVSDSPTVFFAVQAALAIGLTAALAWFYSSSVWICIFTFVSFGFFGYTMVTLRQQLAICIVLLAMPWLQKKRPLPYFLIVALAATIHKSLWILVPLYVLAWIPFNWKSVSAYVAGTVVMLIFTDPILDFVTKFIYKIYTADNYYRAVGRDIQTAVVPMLLFLAVLLLHKRLLRRNPGNLPLMNFSAYACFLFLLTLKSFVFQRLALIFLPVAVLLLPEILNASGPMPDKLAELERLKAEGRGRKPSPKYTQLKGQLRDEMTLYYSAMGFILFIGWLYYLFLVVGNRLLLVPYTTIF
ncbi:EpsG family protein [Yanshouia hominis]|uniref:EpsG family protein n=1 Tax=Yanshouia hominis TaxID=2763673 RepID=A0ABR7NM45_9FIRM|nr:EpsG family protein [Yanshouia hominis]MBC8576718.1 EpsG family protein [Yanshouia hominis]